mmetsp:Transcript_20139/g.44107  ORF Transcript_20139/g.44107 Transcript_20139/m.44107 type:complete len:220 (+) Transcript_20139:911-1570(+)
MPDQMCKSVLVCLLSLTIFLGLPAVLRLLLSELDVLGILRVECGELAPVVLLKVVHLHVQLRHLAPALVLQHVVNHPVLHRLVGSQEEVAVRVLLHLREALATKLSKVIVKGLLVVHHLHRLQIDVLCLAPSSTQRLMDHDAAVRESIALPLGPSRKQEGTHGGSHTDADGLHVRADVTHGVEHRHARCNGATRGVDVEGDILVRVLRVKVKQLRDNRV